MMQSEVKVNEGKKILDQKPEIPASKTSALSEAFSASVPVNTLGNASSPMNIPEIDRGSDYVHQIETENFVEKLCQRSLLKMTLRLRSAGLKVPLVSLLENPHHNNSSPKS
mmetsp:Transcript_33908/g.44730  ORF Transcript_33908/g.44730 Transcript_33908/m.44730 type:complete len:111 (-) Transcript_33908:391-723(-)